MNYSEKSVSFILNLQILFKFKKYQISKLKGSLKKNDADIRACHHWNEKRNYTSIIAYFSEHHVITTFSHISCISFNITNAGFNAMATLKM